MKAKYLCPYCGATFETFDGLKGHALAEHKAESVPMPEGMITLTINGQEYQVQVEPQWTLNYLLHDRLGLTSPKMFCDRGACGSCTVIMEGRPILSCMSLAIECDGKKIETAEGIADAGHPLIESYVKHHCMQCGYCTPGFCDNGQGPAGQDSQSHRGRDHRCPGGQPLPVWHLSPTSQGDIGSG